MGMVLVPPYATTPTNALISEGGFSPSAESAAGMIRIVLIGCRHGSSKRTKRLLHLWKTHSKNKKKKKTQNTIPDPARARGHGYLIGDRDRPGRIAGIDEPPGNTAGQRESGARTPAFFFNLVFLICP